MIPGVILGAASTGWKLVKPFLPHIAIAIGLLGAVWWIHHNGVMSERRENAAREAREVIRAEKQTRQFIDALNDGNQRSDAAQAEKLDAIARHWPSITQTIIKETSNDPRYRDPACTVSDGVWAALTDAVAATRASGVNGSTTVALPDPVDAR
jgi:hypothetical protein